MRGLRTSRRGRALAALTAAGVMTFGMAARANAVGQPVITRTVTHFEKSQHFDPVPACGETVGSTEYAVGTEHLVVVEDGGTLHVKYGEAFAVTEVSDDPSVPENVRHGSDALTLQLVNGGSVTVFHESFHDQPSALFGNIAFYTTFVAVNGEVKVDHFFGRDLPYC